MSCKKRPGLPLQIQSYTKPMFDGLPSSALPPTLFSSENRVATWPWFCLNEVTNSSAATAAAIAFSKLSKSKEELRNKQNLFQLHSQAKHSSLFLSPSKDDNDILNSADTYTMDGIGLSEGAYGKGERSSSLPCSPIGNISTSSTPSLETNSRNGHHERALSPMECHGRSNILQVIIKKKKYYLNIVL